MLLLTIADESPANIRELTIPTISFHNYLRGLNSQVFTSCESFSA